MRADNHSVRLIVGLTAAAVAFLLLVGVIDENQVEYLAGAVILLAVGLVVP